ncbi:MAG: hypothetical protein ACM3UU_07120 [Ignavibacteriales bacterium]
MSKNFYRLIAILSVMFIVTGCQVNKPIVKRDFVDTKQNSQKAVSNTPLKDIADKNVRVDSGYEKQSNKNSKMVNLLPYQGVWYNPLMIYNPKTIHDWNKQVYKFEFSSEEESNYAKVKLYANVKAENIPCTAKFDSKGNGTISINDISENEIFNGEINLSDTNIYINVSNSQDYSASGFFVRKEVIEKIKKCMDIAAQNEGIKNWREKAYNDETAISYSGIENGKYHISVSERPSARAICGYWFDSDTLKYKIGEY